MAIQPPYPTVQEMTAAWIDKSTRAIETIEYEHHEIHEGSHYLIVDVVDLAISNERDIQITTPNTTKWTHLVFALDSENEIEWYLYQNVTINTPGTAVTPINNDRNSAKTSGLTIATIDNTSVANANADTAVAKYVSISIQYSTSQSSPYTGFRRLLWQSQYCWLNSRNTILNQHNRRLR